MSVFQSTVRQLRHDDRVQRIGESVLLSPTDLTKHLGCEHITTLDLLATEGRAQPTQADDALELIFALGLSHEATYLRGLKDQGKEVLTIGAATAQVSRAQRERETVEAMRSGVDVIYQGTFYDGDWGGQADFLVRVDRPSLLGDWSYEIQDTKLSRKLKVPALLQMAAYADRLAVLQGVEPEKLYVITGDGQTRPWRLVDVAAFASRARARLRRAVEDRPATEPVPVSHCAQCRWIVRCDDEWRKRDDLSLVAFMRGDHREALIEHGIPTLAALGSLTPSDLPRTIGQSSRERLVHQAALQLWEREHHKPRYDLLAPVDGMGLLRLPPPSDGDLYLDFEGDPYADDGNGREYLAGLGDRQRNVAPIWAHDPQQERELTITLVDRLLARWQAHTDMHVYHYAAYETTALKRLVAQHGVREAELDQLLRGERFVDLYAVVRQGMRISKSSYSIKKMEGFYWGHIRNQNPDVADAMSSVVAYERWLEERDQATLDQIAAYNKDDVLSTLDLHAWLELRRAELETKAGPQPRPADQPTDPSQRPGDEELAEIRLAQRLQDANEPLLAGLVQFHRREARPAYWEIFRLEDLDTDDLVDDSAALGGLAEPQSVGAAGRSKLYRYEFPPQDTKIGVGDQVTDIDDHKSAGTVVEIDSELGYVILKRQAAPKASRGLTEKQVINDRPIRKAIAAVAEDRLAGTSCLGSSLLDRKAGAVLRDIVTAGLALDDEVLAVQGPPGSGKTTKGAELVRRLIDAGKTVGITANSHEVIGGFLKKIGKPGVQRCAQGPQFCAAGGISRANDTAAVVAALADGCQLVGGTAWLWSQPELQGSVDVIVVDEAGQFSLANAVGVSRAARSMVLLGDPQQLSQPTRALHPQEAGRSALAHMLDGHDTIASDRGVFLGVSWRMHPAITDYISSLAYDGRLHAAPDLERQAIVVNGVKGSGLQVIEVEHAGNSAASRQEVDSIAQLWTMLMKGTFTDRNGVTRPLTADDVLIVAPYNNQVGLLRRAIPGACVGTVDKFQGKEAPVVIYSMTSSSADDAPRGISFLFDIHRLNVAVSRAQAKAVVVMSPTLLDAEIHTPEQLRQVNALCRLQQVARRHRRPLAQLPPQTEGPAGVIAFDPSGWVQEGWYVLIHQGERTLFDSLRYRTEAAAEAEVQRLTVLGHVATAWLATRRLPDRVEWVPYALSSTSSFE